MEQHSGGEVCRVMARDLRQGVFVIFGDRQHTGARNRWREGNRALQIRKTPRKMGSSLSYPGQIAVNSQTLNLAVPIWAGGGTGFFSTFHPQSHSPK